MIRSAVTSLDAHSIGRNNIGSKGAKALAQSLRGCLVLNLLKCTELQDLLLYQLPSTEFHMHCFTVSNLTPLAMRALPSSLLFFTAAAV